MHTLASILFCLTGVALLASPANAVPAFKVNLDDAPEKRWVGITEHYRQKMVPMLETFMSLVDKQMSDEEQQAFLNAVDFGPKIDAELQGIADTLESPNVTVASLKLFNLIYELGSPTACSGVLWATENGTVMHGRNMDYSLQFKMPDGQILNWPDVTFEVTFMKSGKPLYKATQWPGIVGIHTAMRFNGWGFEQNTRLGKNNWRDNLEAAKKGGQPFLLFARSIMEETATFDEAVEKLYGAKFMAPMYFIISGTGPFQGVVLTIDRLGEHLVDTPPAQKFSKSHSDGAWQLLQTNDDPLGTPLDSRRDVANELQQNLKQDSVSETLLAQFMHTPLLLNPMTVFSTVMVPATGYYKTVLPMEPPGPLPLQQLSLESGGKDLVRSKPRVRRQTFLSAHADTYNEY